MTAPTPERPAAPFSGPIDRDPLRQVAALAEDPLQAIRVSREMLATAVADLDTGDYDDEVIGWVCATWDTSTIATVASLLHRARTSGRRVGSVESADQLHLAWRNGVDVGRREQIDATPVVQHLRATLAALEADLAERNGRVSELRVQARALAAERDALGAALDDITRSATEVLAALGMGRMSGQYAAEWLAGQVATVASGVDLVERPDRRRAARNGRPVVEPGIAPDDPAGGPA